MDAWFDKAMIYMIAMIYGALLLVMMLLFMPRTKEMLQLRKKIRSLNRRNRVLENERDDAKQKAADEHRERIADVGELTGKVLVAESREKRACGRARQASTRADTIARGEPKFRERRERSAA